MCGLQHYQHYSIISYICFLSYAALSQMIHVPNSHWLIASYTGKVPMFFNNSAKPTRWFYLNAKYTTWVYDGAAFSCLISGWILWFMVDIIKYSIFLLISWFIIQLSRYNYSNYSILFGLFRGFFLTNAHITGPPMWRFRSWDEDTDFQVNPGWISCWIGGGIIWSDMINYILSYMFIYWYYQISSYIIIYFQILYWYYQIWLYIYILA